MANGVGADVTFVRDVAAAAFDRAIEMSALVAILGSGNSPDVAGSLERRGAGIAGRLVQLALFHRLLLWTTMPFDPVRKGDRHLRAAIERAQGPDVFSAASASYHPKLLRDAIDRFADLDGSEPLETLRHLRNKEAAHLSEWDPNIERPKINDLLQLAGAVAAVSERFALGTGVISLTLKSQLLPYIDSAFAFWRPWTEQAPKP